MNSVPGKKIVGSKVFVSKLTLSIMTVNEWLYGRNLENVNCSASTLERIVKDTNY